MNGWSYDDSVGNWKLVYTDNTVVIYEQTDQPIATQSVLFVGTEQECEEQIELCGLIKPIIEEPIIEEPIIEEPILTDELAATEEAEPILTDELAGNEEAEPILTADFL
jgi:hypothetical protein